MSCGLNSAAILLAHALGAQSVFTASGKERIARVTALGGTVGVDYREEDFLAAVMEATNGRGMDVVIDFIGGLYLEDRRDFLQGDGQPDYDLYE